MLIYFFNNDENDQDLNTSLYLLIIKENCDKKLTKKKLKERNNKMCNGCDCENYEKCSIVGYLPVGYCCPKCTFYNEGHECLALSLKLDSNVISNPKKIELFHF